MPALVLHIIPAAVLLFWAVRIFLRKDVSKPQLLMSAGLAVAGLSIFLWEESALFIFPFFFLGLREITAGNGVSKWDWLCFIPSVVFSVLDDKVAFDVFIIIQVFAVLVWSSIVVLRHNRISAEFYDTSEDTTVTLTQILLFMIAASFVAPVLMILPDNISFRGPINLFLFLFLSFLLYMLGQNVYNLSSRPRIPCENENTTDWVGGAPVDRKLLQRVIDEKMFLDPAISLVSLAETLHTNRTYLSNSIHACFNRNFSDFINHLRIDYAIELMRASLPDVNIKEVAARSGYNHPQSFYRNFTQIMDMTPGTWLSRQNGAH